MLHKWGSSWNVDSRKKARNISCLSLSCSPGGSRHLGRSRCVPGPKIGSFKAKTKERKGPREMRGSRPRGCRCWCGWCPRTLRHLCKVFFNKSRRQQLCLKALIKTHLSILPFSVAASNIGLAGSSPVTLATLNSPRMIKMKMLMMMINILWFSVCDVFAYSCPAPLPRPKLLWLEKT